MKPFEALQRSLKKKYFFSLIFSLWPVLGREGLSHPLPINEKSRNIGNKEA